MGQSHSVVQYHPSAVSSDQFAAGTDLNSGRGKRSARSRSEGIVNFAPDHHNANGASSSAPRSLTQGEEQRVSSVGPLRNRPGASRPGAPTISAFDLAALRGQPSTATAENPAKSKDKADDAMQVDPASRAAEAANGEPQADGDNPSYTYGYAYSDDTHLGSLANQVRPASGAFRVSIQPSHPIIPELDESEGASGDEGKGEQREKRRAASRGPREVAAGEPSSSSRPGHQAEPGPAISAPPAPSSVDHSRRTSATSVSSSLVSAAATAAAWTAASAPSPVPSFSNQLPARAPPASAQRRSWASGSSTASSASTTGGGRTVAAADSQKQWPAEMEWTSNWEDRRGSDNVGDDSEPSPPRDGSRSISDAASSPMRLPVHVTEVDDVFSSPRAKPKEDIKEAPAVLSGGAARGVGSTTPQRSPAGPRRPLPALPLATSNEGSAGATLMTPGIPSHSRSHTSLLSAAAASSQALEDDDGDGDGDDGEERREEMREPPLRSSQEVDITARPESLVPPRSPSTSSTHSLRRKPAPTYDGDDDAPNDHPSTPTSPTRILWPTQHRDSQDDASSSRERHTSPLLIRRSHASGVSAETEALLLHVDRLRSGPALAVDRSALELFAVPEEGADKGPRIGEAPSPSRRPRALSLIGKIKERVRKASISSSSAVMATSTTHGDVTLSPTRAASTSPTVERRSPLDGGLTNGDKESASQPPLSPTARLRKLSMSRKERRALAAVSGGKRSVSGPAKVQQAQQQKLSPALSTAMSRGFGSTESQQRAVHRQTSSSSLRGNRPRSVRSARSLRSKRSSGSSFVARNALGGAAAAATASGSTLAAENDPGSRMPRSGSNSGSWWKAAGGLTAAGSPILRSDHQSEWHDEEDTPSTATKRKGWGAWPRRKSSNASNGNNAPATGMSKSLLQSYDGTSQAATNSTASLVAPGDGSAAATPSIPTRGESPPLAIIGAEGFVAEPGSMYGNSATTFSSLAPPPPPAPLPPLRPSRKLNRAASSEAASPAKTSDTPKLRSEDEASGAETTPGGERSVSPFVGGMAAFVAAPPSPVTAEPRAASTVGTQLDVPRRRPSPPISPKTPGWTPGVIRRPRPIPRSPSADEREGQRSVSAPAPSLGRATPDPDSTVTALTFGGGADADTSISRDAVGDVTVAEGSGPVASLPPAPAVLEDAPEEPVPFAETAVQASLAALAALERAREGTDWRAQWARNKLLGASSTANEGSGFLTAASPVPSRFTAASRRRSDAGLSTSEVSDDYSGSRPRRRASPYNSRRGAQPRSSDEEALRSSKSRRRESKRYVSVPVTAAAVAAAAAAAAAAALTSDDAAGETSPSKSGDDAAELARAAAARKAADARLRTSSTSRRKHDRPTLAQQRAWEDLAGLYEAGERRPGIAGDATGPRLSPSGPRPRPPIPSFELSPPGATRVASEGADTSATSPPDWDEVIVPAVQKRLDAEAAAAKAEAEAEADALTATPTGAVAAAPAADDTQDTLAPAAAFNADAAPNTPMTLATLSSPLQHHERLATYVRSASKEGRRDGLIPADDEADFGALEAKRGGGASPEKGRKSGGGSRRGGAGAATSASAAAGSRIEGSTTRSRRDGTTTSGSHHRHRSSGTRRSTKQGYSGEDIRAWQAALGLALGHQPAADPSAKSVASTGP